MAEQTGGTVEAVVAKLSELKDGEMKEVDVGDNKVLLIKDKGHFKAIGAKCTHYGAPLKGGVYYNGGSRCPWHGARFDTSSGDIEDYPGGGCIPKFDVSVNGNDVVLTTTPVVTKKLAAKNDSDSRLFVIIGGGAAGAIAAETLRTEGYTGRLIVIDRFKTLPYDRTKLSKVMDSQLDKILLKPEEFYKCAGIEFLLGALVTELDPDAKTITLGDGQVLHYTKALIATGADSQKLAFIPGHNGTNVYTLRTIEEAHAIFSAVEGKNVVIIGSSFIGMEVAASIVKKSKSITVVGMENVPFERVLGGEIGKVLQQFHEAQGIKFVLNAIAKEFLKSDDGAVHTIVLKDDSKIAADIVIIGAGVLPATSFLKESPSIKRERDRSIIVDKHLWTGADGLFAAGDMAKFPLKLLHDELVRIEHWGISQTMGSVAAKNMAAEKPNHPFISVPVFWTAQYGKSIRYAGHALHYEKVILDTAGEKIDPTNPKFVAYYSHNDNIVAVCTVQRDPIAAQVAEIFYAQLPLTATEVEAAIAGTGNTNALLATKLKQ